MKLRKISWIVLSLCLLAAGCQSHVTVEQVSESDRINYNNALPDMREPSPETRNLLGNFLLLEMYRDDPERLLLQLEKLFRNEKRNSYLVALADVALHAGFRNASHPDVAARYFLSAAIYSYDFLREQDNTSNPYDTGRIQMMRLYNVAVSELFSYLRSRQLERKSNFELTTATGQSVFFRAPLYRLPLPEDNFREFLLCADFRPLNFTHNSRDFGIGAPLISTLNEKNAEENYAKGQIIPSTLIMRFSSPWKGERLEAGLKFLYARNEPETRIGGKTIPLASDFSTPLAYMVKDPPLLGSVERMIFPERSLTSEGLYHFEPYSDKRIPVVLVHGLMSDMRTWVQLINTLQNDPEIRNNYQFLGFSYSSGNPIFVSAQKLRRELLALQERVRKNGGDTKQFNRMVLIGHSMGGLLSRLQISGCDSQKIRELLSPEAEQKIRTHLDPDELKEIDEMTRFEPLPFVNRVIFIAVPHRGSDLAGSWIGRLGSSLIRLPRKAIRYNKAALESLVTSQKLPFRLPEHPLNGIDNLNPDNMGLRLLNSLEMSPKVPFHSIIGNRKSEGVPGGGDGVVAYSSSHLDKARSELVVKSDHSAHRNPLAIQELRRILLLHLAGETKKP